MQQSFFSLLRFARTSFVFFFVLFFVGCSGNVGTSLASSGHHHDGSTAASQPAPDFKAFIGSWVSHSAGLTFYADGSADYKERVYRWCGPGVAQPCDSFQGNTIINGDIEKWQFTRQDNANAYGDILSSTVGHTGSSVSLTLKSDDTLLVSKESTTCLLCGPHAPVGACGA